MPLPVNFEIASSKIFIHFNNYILKIFALFILVSAFQMFAENNAKRLFFYITIPWCLYIYEFRIIETIILFLSAVYYRTKKYNTPLIILIFILTFTALQNNRSLKIFLKNYDLARATLEVNEKQKFISEHLIRKITYNKLTYVVDISISHFISFFDFEQWSSPKDSYELIKLSGLSPKNNPLILFTWQIPIVFFGLLKYKPRAKLIFLGACGVGIFLIFEKKNLADSSFLVIPLIASVYYNGIKNIEEKLSSFALYFLLLLSFFSSTQYLAFYHKFPQKFLNTDLIYYQKIGSWLNSNSDNYPQIIISQRFGPTETFIPYYFEGNNITYRSYYFAEENNSENLYIGLSGEFVGKGKNTDTEIIPNNIDLIDKIQGEDEVVFEHGKELWIGIQK